MRSQDITIRVATLDDAKDIAYIHKQSWQESYVNILNDEYLKSITLEDRILLREKLLQRRSKDVIYLIASYKDKIIGFCDAGPCRMRDNKVKGEIYAIYILKGYKNKGIGTKLIEEAKKFLDKRKLNPFITWVFKENIAARRFYEKNNGQEYKYKSEQIGNLTYEEIAYIFEKNRRINKKWIE